MEAFYEKSMEVLELPRVLEMAAEFAVSQAAKEKVLALRPEKYRELVEEQLEQTDTARRLILRRGAPGFSGIHDVSLGLRRAEMGGALNPRELLDIAELLRAARLAKGYLDGEEEKTSLDPLFSRLQANKFLEERISTAILSEEEIADMASPLLADIRRHMRANHERIRSTLQRIISSPSYQKYLQEPIITIRADRYVVPVKAEHRNAVSGLVHDVSASGATFFIEPMQVVQLNNELKELLSREEAEIERILLELSAQAAEHKEDILSDFEALVALDVVFAKGKFSSSLDAVSPKLRTDGGVYLKNARHPMLERKSAVPITIDLGRTFDTLVITGPNTGGKTVALKTTGLLVIMAECGLQVPADEGSEISLFDAVYADIGDEQSIQQSLSTFSSHMKNIVGILERTDDRSLALFDELGAGTDPVEGAALAVAIIQYVRSLGTKVAATTHYAELKVFAMTTPGVENASCEFDVETLRPTYKLLIGIPGRSNAFAISSRLGLPDYIVDQARGLVSQENTRFEDVLSEIEQRRQEMEKLLRQAAADRLEAENLRKAAQSHEQAMARQREQYAETAKRKAEELLEDARRTSDQVMEELRRLQREKSADWQKLNDARADMRHKLNQAQEKLGRRREPEKRAEPPRDLKQGETVELIKLGTQATVLTPPDKDGLLRVQAGIMQVRVRADEVRRVKEKAPQPPAMQYMGKSRDELKIMSAKTELDLRGMTATEALLELDQFLDNAMMAGLNTVSVIHGKGTGALRAAVHDALKRNKHVSRYRLGRYGEGETGVTIVEIQ